jgi:hypothetical protein
MGYSPHTRSWLESRQAPGSARARRETWDGLFHHAQEICEGGWQSDKQSASQRFPSWQPLQLALQHLQPSPRLPIPLAHGLRHPGPVAHRQTLTWPSVAAWPPRPRIRRLMRTSNAQHRTSNLKPREPERAAQSIGIQLRQVKLDLAPGVKLGRRFRLCARDAQ